MDIPPASSHNAHERRRSLHITAIPKHYSWIRHLASTTLFCVGLAVLAFFMARHAPLSIWLITVPASVVFANVFEWVYHRFLMHEKHPFDHLRRRLGIASKRKKHHWLFYRHTIEHHSIFTWTDMGSRARREFYHILMPFRSLLTFAIYTTVVALFVRLLFSGEVGWIFLGVACLYVVFYEYSHLMYHCSCRRWGIISALARHHARHHEPAMMQKFNFNITLPIADMIFRTFAPRILVRRLQKRYADRGIEAP